MNFQSAKWTADSLGVSRHLCVEFRQLGIVVGNPQATPGVHVFDGIPITAQLPNQSRDTLHSFRKRLGAGNLRADMHADSRNFQMPAGGCAGIELPRLLYRYAEFVLVEPGGDVWMSLCRNLRIDPQCDPGLLLQPRSAFRELPQFGFALCVEKEDAISEGQAHLVRSF